MRFVLLHMACMLQTDQDWEPTLADMHASRAGSPTRCSVLCSEASEAAGTSAEMMSMRPAPLAVAMASSSFCSVQQTNNQTQPCICVACMNV